jgi:hypothetical protein
MLAATSPHQGGDRLWAGRFAVKSWQTLENLTTWFNFVLSHEGGVMSIQTGPALW